MKYRLQLIVFFLTVIIILISIEIFYTKNPIPTNTTEARIIQIDNLKKMKIDYAIFGSSVSNGVLGSNPYILEDVFSGTTSAQLTLFGQYFLSQKLYKKNQELKKIYISFVPHMLAFDVINQKNKRVRREFNNVFKEKEFIDLLKEVDKNYKIEHKDYFIQRRIYIDKFLQGKKRKIFFGNHTTFSHKNFLLNDCNLTSKDIKKQIIKFSKSISKQKMNNQYVYLIKRISEFNQTHKTKIAFILEPVPLTEYTEFTKNSSYNKFANLIKKYNIEFIDSNKITKFKDCYFKDYLHLNAKSTGIYLNILFDILGKKIPEPNI